VLKSSTGAAKDRTFEGRSLKTRQLYSKGRYAPVERAAKNEKAGGRYNNGRDPSIQTDLTADFSTKA
jgi:hypothetical protein